MPSMKSSVLSTARRKTSEPAEKFAFFFYYSRNTHDAFWAIIRSCFCWPAVRFIQVLFVVDYVLLYLLLVVVVLGASWCC